VPTLPQIEAFKDDLVAIRHDIHAHPEIGFEEVRTSAIVAGKLASWGIEVHRGIGKHRRRRHSRRQGRPGQAHRPARRHGRAADGGDHEPALALDHSRAQPWLRP
jgi:metal-dependent amidase/aminoacylase/carboxypeptidase family protein